MKFFGQFSPPVDEILYERYFKYQIDPGFFIECGAADGISESCCYFFERNLRWVGINIEASPKIYQALIKNRPNSKNLNIALSDSINQKVIFRATVHPHHGELFGNGSLSHTPEHLEDLKQQNVTFHDVEVTTSTYSHMLNELNVHKVDLFILDIEGHELLVLKSLSEKMPLPTVFVIEHGHLGQSGLMTILGPLGYELDYTFENNSYFILNRALSPEMIRSIFEHTKRIQEKDALLKETDMKFKQIHTELESKHSRIQSELNNVHENILNEINKNRSIGRAIYERYFKKSKH